MTEFKCDKCFKIFATKWNLKRHGERKTPCIPAETENSTHTIQNGMCESQNGMCENQNGMCDKKNGMCNKNNNISSKKNVIKPIKLYICVCCNKSYSDKVSKYKHQIKCKNSNKSIKKEENVKNIKEIIKKLKNTDKSLVIKNNEIKLVKNKNIKGKDKDNILNTLSDKLLTKKIVKITNNNTTNNTYNNNISNSNNNNTTNNTTNNNVIININAFGKENLDSLSLPTIKKIFSKKYGCFNTALSEIYANIPENNNFYIANKGNSKYMKIYNGKKCEYERSNKFNTRLSDNTMSHLEVLLDKNKDKIVKQHTAVIEKVIHEYFGGELTDRYREEVELFILNHTDDMKEVLTTTLNKLKNK